MAQLLEQGIDGGLGNPAAGVVGFGGVTAFGEGNGIHLRQFLKGIVNEPHLIFPAAKKNQHNAATLSSLE
ncbi:hypothetical protein PRtIB026_A26440 [Pseudomonas sp. RtIB026]|nr:hypothetical protein PRtIB026_A26440 [Pseudomonas sp. RtIB026]